MKSDPAPDVGLTRQIYEELMEARLLMEGWESKAKCARRELCRARHRHRKALKNWRGHIGLDA